MFFKVLQIVIPLVWFGAIGAISFMEAPLKFRSPNVTLALGLGIGKIVFRALNRIEIVFALLVLVSLFAERPDGNFPLYLYGVIFVLLALQTVWLLPRLTVRAEQVISGVAAPHSKNHLIYIVFEAIKFLLLLVLGVNLLRQNLRLE